MQSQKAPRRSVDAHWGSHSQRGPPTHTHMQGAAGRRAVPAQVSSERLLLSQYKPSVLARELQRALPLQRKPDTAYKREGTKFVHGLQPKTRSAWIPAPEPSTRKADLPTRRVKQALSEERWQAPQRASLWIGPLLCQVWPTVQERPPRDSTSRLKFIRAETEQSPQDQFSPSGVPG